MESLFDRAIYVNASPDHLQQASRGSKISQPITERKRWVSGHELFMQARQRGERVALVFGYNAPLTSWALAADVSLGEDTTSYRFVDLRNLDGFKRSDLIVDSTGQPLPETFIRSYAIVRTPDFLSIESKAAEIDPAFGDFAGLEGELLQRMVVHRHRETKLREAKIHSELLRQGGKLVCEVPGCGFDFQKVYGDLGARYAHVHHTRPLSDREEDEITKIDDLKIVCANCHSMIHRGGECRSMEKLIVRPLPGSTPIYRRAK